MRKTHWAAVGVVVGAAFLYLMAGGGRWAEHANPGSDRQPPPEARRARPTAVARADSASPRPPRSAEPTDPANRPAPSMVDGIPSAPLSRRTALEHYLRASRFPPTSRPLTLANTDLTHPNRRHESKRRSQDNPDLTFLFTADRYFVMDMDGLTATLQVWRNDVSIPAQVMAAGLRVVSPTPGPVVPIAFTSANEMAVATFAPGELIEGPHAMIVALDITFAVDETVENASISFQFTPPNGVPARFTGQFADSVVGGSLLVRAGLQIFQAGYYIVDANLWADDQPVAWTRFKGALPEGEAEVPLEFFGKAIHARNLEGPYRIGELRGARFDEGRNPDMDHIPSIETTYQTTAYPLDVFSNADWTSSFKQRKIEALKRATLDPARQSSTASDRTPTTEAPTSDNASMPQSPDG